MPDAGTGTGTTTREETDTDEKILTEEEMRDYQKRNLARALEQTRWRVSGPNGAAQLLGVKPTTLADRIRAFGIKRPGKR